MEAPPTVSVQVDKVAAGLHHDIPGYHTRQRLLDSQGDPESVGYPDH